jgi:hypothetical protein
MLSPLSGCNKFTESHSPVIAGLSKNPAGGQFRRGSGAPT